MVAGNSNWIPMQNKQAVDILLSKDKLYQVSLFQNDNGSQSISISEIIDEYAGVKFDKVSDQVSLFNNADGSQNVAVSEVIDSYEDVKFDKVSDSVSQPAMKSIAEALESKKGNQSHEDD